VREFFRRPLACLPDSACICLASSINDLYLSGDEDNDIAQREHSAPAALEAWSHYSGYLSACVCVCVCCVCVCVLCVCVCMCVCVWCVWLGWEGCSVNVWLFSIRCVLLPGRLLCW